ncbi:MAG: glycoside hydrolase family 2 TIM barrel-domain containing protein, partial [Bacilli bacterium]
MKIKISDNWKFIDNFDNSYLKKKPTKLEKIELPHTTKELPYNYFDEEEYQKVSTYFRDINLKEDEIKNKNLFLKFDGIMLKARIILNNHDFGNFISGFMPFQIDITKYAKVGVNSLVVVVDSREDKTIPPFGNIVDYLTFGGIYRDVFLLIKPKKYISNLYCNGDMHGNLNISYTLSDNVTANYTLTYELYFDKKLIQSFVNSETIVENAKLWNPEHPNLYTLKAILNDENITDEMEVRFGFRSVKFTKKGFYLNQKPIKLIGLNRHQAYPYVGYAMPRSAQEDDANLLKSEIGVNVVRCSHYPPSDYFLAKCDEIGLMVFDEVPGWQFVSNDKIWRDNFYDFVERMV